MNSISPVYARIVLRELERRQIVTHTLFAGTDLTRELLLQGGDIALEDFVQILRIAHELSGDDRLGLMIGSHAQIFTLGGVGAAMAIAPSVRQGLQVVESFTRLHTSYLSLRASSNFQGLALQLRFEEELGETLRFHVESAAMLIQNYVETLTALPLDKAVFRLAIPEPDYAQSYPDYFHSPIEFNATMFEVQLPLACLDLPSPYYNAKMWRQAQAQLSVQLKNIDSKIKQPYTMHLVGLFNSNELPLPDLSTVAGTLCMSERTLNRRLLEEGVNYRQLKSEALISRAKQHLANTDKSVEAIAADLGYQDAANFRRAFRKVTRHSPREYRSNYSPGDALGGLQLKGTDKLGLLTS